MVATSIYTLKRPYGLKPKPNSKIMSDFWSIYENEIHERFELQKTVCNSESHRELISFEILVGMMLLRPRTATIKVEIPDEKYNEQYFCPKCNEDFKSKLTHMIGKHPNHCPYCPMIYSHVSNLTYNHIKKQHQTLYNDFVAARKMRTDRQAEENLKKHACKICLKKFIRPSDVQRHGLTHELTRKAEKLFACKICNKRYTRSSYVVEHTKELHGSINYNCKFCNFQTSGPFKLRKHEKKMHLNISH